MTPVTLTPVAEETKGWPEWVDFMVKTHEYAPWDVRIVKQFEFLQQFLERLPPGGRVLDVGAGQCEMERFFQGWRYVATDAGIGDASWDYSKLDAASNIQCLPFPDATFDAAINLWVAEHVRNPFTMVSEVARVLKPGGWFLAFLPFVVHEHQTPHDYFRFTRFGVAALLEDNGFVEVTVAPDSSLGFAVAYESVKHLNALRAVAGLPPEWKTHLDNACQVVTQLTFAFAKEREFPAAAPALSFMAMGRRAESRRERPPAPAPARSPARPAAPAPRRVNVGCGNQKMPGWIGIDVVKTPTADIVRDVTRGLPFDDSSVDEIYCDNVLEHIGPNADFLFVLNEFYRVLRPGGIATIIVPDGRSQAAWQDPTHQRAFVRSEERRVGKECRL